MGDADYARLDERLTRVLADVLALEQEFHHLEIYGSERMREALLLIDRSIAAIIVDFQAHEEREKQRIEKQQDEWQRNRSAVMLAVLGAALSVGVALATAVISRL